MVLGMILYEGVDITYNIMRIGYDSIIGVYNWWYEIEEHKHHETHKENLEMIQQLKILNNRVKELEDVIIENKIDNKINNKTDD
tara:strand:- start:154 stop:405 length:252 start_codon:yes stop_codon:yes gene_type:complete